MAKRSQLPLTALRAFEAFARLGKMSLAADELCVTHGAVSRQVRSLEALCGVKLTQGPRNALKLPDAGERLARSLGRTFDELEQSFLEVRAAGLPVAHPPFPVIADYLISWQSHRSSLLVRNEKRAALQHVPSRSGTRNELATRRLIPGF